MKGMNVVNNEYTCIVYIKFSTGEGRKELWSGCKVMQNTQMVWTSENNGSFMG